MSLTGMFKNAANKLDSGYKKYKDEAPERDRARMARLKTQAEREKERAAIQRERLEAKREVTQAKTSLRKAQNEYKESKGGSFDIGSIFKKKPVKSSPPRRITKTVKRRKAVKTRKPSQSKRSTPKGWDWSK